MKNRLELNSTRHPLLQHGSLFKSEEAYFNRAINVSEPINVWKCLKQEAHANALVNSYPFPLVRAIDLWCSSVGNKDNQWAVCMILLSKGASIESITTEGKALWQVALEHSDKSLYVAMQTKYPTHPQLQQDFSRESYDFQIRISNADFSEFQTSLTLSLSFASAANLRKILPYSQLEDNFIKLFGIEAIHPLLEILQLSVIGLSHLKDQFQGFYVNDEALLEYYHQDKLGNYYINIPYIKEQIFDLNVFIRNCIRFIMEELSHNGYKLFDSSARHPYIPISINEADVQCHPELISACRAHANYLRAKHGLFKEFFVVTPQGEEQYSAAAVENYKS